MGKKDDSLGVMTRIIIASRGGKKKTEIMKDADVSFSQFEGYSQKMLEEDFGFLKVGADGDGRMVYSPTQKGLDYVDAYRILISKVPVRYRPNKNAYSKKRQMDSVLNFKQ